QPVVDTPMSRGNLVAPARGGGVERPKSCRLSPPRHLRPSSAALGSVSPGFRDGGPRVRRRRRALAALGSVSPAFRHAAPREPPAALGSVGPGFRDGGPRERREPRGADGLGSVGSGLRDGG